MAKLMMDIKLDSTGDLDVSTGDFTIVESTAVHAEALIVDAPGDYKENPMVGVGVWNFIDDDGFGSLTQEIVKQFTRDGMKVVNVSVNNAGVINSDAYYV